MTDWLISLGYLGAFIGAFVEGELILFTVVQTARSGYLTLAGVVASFFIGTLIADWFFFLTGRYRGRTYLGKYKRLQKPLANMETLFAQKGRALLFGYRFMYGFRSVLPLLFGLSNISIAEFALYSLVSTSVWITFFTIVSYYFSDLFLQLSSVLTLWGWILVFVLILALGWLFYKQKQK